MDFVPPTFKETNVQLEIGWFDRTLPTFLIKHPGVPCHLVHIDCDVYESAECVLRLLVEGNRLVSGTILVFDELLNYNGFERHEMLALFEMLKRLNDRCHKSNRWSIEWIGSKHEGCMSVALKLVRSKK
jgi:hypothetical protein